MDLYAIHVEADSRTELDTYTADAFLSRALEWRILGRRIHEAWWLSELEQMESRSLARSINWMPDDVAGIAGAIEVELVLAQAWRFISGPQFVAVA